jgi:hypothetical protein
LLSHLSPLPRGKKDMSKTRGKDKNQQPELMQENAEVDYGM